MPDLIPLLGTSAAMEQLRHKVQRVAATPLPVLITGETGTGKEVVARQLHARSGRPGPFVPVDCAALSSSLVESELFGHERGAFTGANQRREGLIAAAQGGTFFLDEVGELPIAVQTRLLRILESATYRPVGSQTERRAEIRVIAATWRELGARVREGLFREDLYHRLAIVELVTPPLRDRPEDIEALLGHFMEEEAVACGRAVPRLDAVARAHLQRWPWPGNVRELKNVASYITAMTLGSRVGLSELPRNLHRASPDQPISSGGGAFTGLEIRIDLPYMEARRLWLDDFQQRYVEAILDAHDGNVSAAARAAGMDRRSIQRILGRQAGRDPASDTRRPDV